MCEKRERERGGERESVGDLMDIIVVRVQGDATSKTLDKAVCIWHSAYIIEKAMNPTIFPQTIGK